MKKNKKEKKLPNQEDEPPGKHKTKRKNNHSLPKRVGIIYSDVKREYFPTEVQYITEKTALPDAEKIAQYLNQPHIKT